jgi:hypothetical protein
MADESSPIEFEDVPLDQARMMGRGPCMEPMLYETLRNKVQSLSTEATRIHLGPEITPARMKRYLLHMARELKVPVTVRSTGEDAQQAQEIASRLQVSRQRGRTAPQRPNRTRNIPRR